MLTDANAIIERLDALFVENFRIEAPSPDAAGHLAAPTGLEASFAQTDCRAHAAAEPGSGDSTQQP